MQIIENRFKPSNIYRLLASEKDRAETQRTISIGGVEFEQAERDGRESEYRMSGFFKAWAAYSGILVKLSPLALQGDLATALFIYTMSLYDLLEKYTWEGVKAYHFQFHRKRVASGKSLYLPQEWRQLHSELVTSKCFAYPGTRTTWNQGPSCVTMFPHRISELPFRESPHSTIFNYHFPVPNTGQALVERRPRVGNHINYTPSGVGIGFAGPASTASQVCRNWNFRECRTANCRPQDICITCGNGHKAVQCSQAGSTQLGPQRTSRPYAR